MIPTPPQRLDDVAAEEAGSEEELPAASPVHERGGALEPHGVAVDDAECREQRGERVPDERGVKVWSGELATATTLNQDVTTAFPVDQAIGDLQPGVYVMTAEAKGPGSDSDGSLATQWFIVTDLGLTTIYVTHDQEDALAMSTRIAVMNKGRIEQLGPPEALYDLPRTQFVANFVGQANTGVATVEGASVYYLRYRMAYVNGPVLANVGSSWFELATGEDFALWLRRGVLLEDVTWPQPLAELLEQLVPADDRDAHRVGHHEHDEERTQRDPQGRSRITEQDRCQPDPRQPPEQQTGGRAGASARRGDPAEVRRSAPDPLGPRHVAVRDVRPLHAARDGTAPAGR